MNKIVYVVNTLEFFNSHRLPLAIEAGKKGCEVHVVANISSEDLISENGLTYHHLAFSRSGQNPFYEFIILYRLLMLLLKIRPDLLHLVTIKPVLYGGIVGRLIRVKSVVAAISGLGSVFSASNWADLVRLWLVKALYRTALNHKNLTVIFQNEDDKRKLLSAKAVKESKARLIRGSGVSLKEYDFTVEPGEELVVTVSMAARLLKEKGVCEFVGAARLLKQRNVAVNMQLIGSPDPGNPSSITEEDIRLWEKEGLVTFLGYRKDIAELYSRSHIVCLPSYYGEGLPKSLVEAAACGRAIITTDMPGCRDAIIPGKTGVLVPAKDSVALANAIQYLVENPDHRAQMGKAGRKLAEEEFTIEHVVERHMDIYQELMSRG